MMIDSGLSQSASAKLADYAAKRIIEPIELPVDITTVLLGAPYLVFLL
jgi:ABC-type Fe3+-siderophore transport system permease subunit